MQRSALCRSRRELSNAYLLANLASIQLRTNLVKFARSPCTDPPGYPDRRTYDAPGVLEAPDVPDGPDVLAGYPHLRKNFPGFKVPNHHSCSAESNASAEQLSASSGHRTPPFTDRLNPFSRDRDFVSGSGTQNLSNTPPPYDTGVVPM